MQNSYVVQSALNRSGTLTMSSREIADLVQSRHADVIRSIERLMASGVISEYAPMAYTHEQNHQRYLEYLINKRDSYVVVAQLSPEFTARLVDRWQELEDAVALSFQQPHVNDKIHAELLFAETAARMLNISSSGKLGMLKTIQSIHGLPNFLPSYAIDAPSDAVDGSSRPTFSATELLRRFDVSISAKAFNMLLENNGIIKRAARPSTKAPGKQKEFWVVTGKGLMYGKNVVDHRCPRETQPHWFETRFNDLLKSVGLSGKAAA